LLSQALRKIPAEDMLAAITESPTGAYIRIACFLWEVFNKQELKGAPTVTGVAANLFRPQKIYYGTQHT